LPSVDEQIEKSLSLPVLRLVFRIHRMPATTARTRSAPMSDPIRVCLSSGELRKDVLGVVTGLLLISEMIKPGVSSFSISKFAWLGVTVIICSAFVVVVDLNAVVVPVVVVEVVVVVTSNDWAYMNSSMSK